MNAFYWVNRVLWAAIVVMLIGVAGLAFLYKDPSQTPVEPLQVPQIGAASAPVQDTPVSGRNPFDPTGRPWHSKVKEKASLPGTAGAGGSSVVLGVVTLSGSVGVFTRDRFVPLGGSIDGGTLQSVTEQAAVIRTPQGSKELRLQSGDHPSWDSLTGDSTGESKE